jgi:hypothetical protein
MEAMWLAKTGRPAHDFDDYDPTSLAALLTDKILRGAAKEAQGTAPSRQRWGPPRTLTGPKGYDQAIVTGDPVVDEWEREIAAGRVPNI